MSQVCTGVDGRCQTKTKPRKNRIYHYRSKSHQRVACTKFPCSTPPKQYLSVGGSKKSGCYFRLRQLLLVFKAINLSQPPYLSALIRSSSLTRGNRLSISSTRPNKHIGRRGFAVAAPAEWNKLPQTVGSQQTIDGFRSQLKTYLGWHTPHLSYTLAGAF